MRYALRVMPAVTAIAALCAAGGCAPQVHVLANQQLTVTIGGQGTLTLATDAPACNFPMNPNGLPCADLSGRTFEYVLAGVPSGVTYTIDHSLQGAATPGLVRITFAVATGTVPSNYHILAHATVDGRILGTADVLLRVPADSLPPTTPPIFVAAGPTFSVAALADGTVWTWGGGDAGELGLGARRVSPMPAMVADLIGVRAVSAGLRHVLVATESGEVWGWGSNVNGQLGRRPRTPDEHFDAPVRIGGLAAITAVSAARDFSLALDVNGSVWSWGDNGSLAGIDPRPTRVPNLPPIRAIASDWTAAVAADRDGAVWQWEAGEPRQVERLTGIRSVAITGGDTFALDRGGDVWAWGLNAPKFAGAAPDATNSLSPIRISALRDIAAIAASWAGHPLARSTTGTLLSWDGLSRWTPTSLPEPREIAAAGDDLVTLGCGAIWSRGRNDAFQLGDGAVQDRRSFGPVLGIGREDGCPRVSLRALVAGAPPGDEAIRFDPAPPESSFGLVDTYGTFERGSVVTVTAPPQLTRDVSLDGSRNVREISVFERWALDCSSSDAVTTVVLDRSKRCAAVYRSESLPVSQPGFTLTVTITAPPGSSGAVIGTSAGSTINCLAAGSALSVCSQTFPPGTAVQVKPAGGEDAQFGGWTSGCDSITGANRCNVVLTGDRTVVATFVR